MSILCKRQSRARRNPGECTVPPASSFDREEGKADRWGIARRQRRLWRWIDRSEIFIPISKLAHLINKKHFLLHVHYGVNLLSGFMTLSSSQSPSWHIRCLCMNSKKMPFLQANAAPCQDTWLGKWVKGWMSAPSCSPGQPPCTAQSVTLGIFPGVMRTVCQSPALSCSMLWIPW